MYLTTFIVPEMKRPFSTVIWGLGNWSMYNSRVVRIFQDFEFANLSSVNLCFETLQFCLRGKINNFKQALKRFCVLRRDTQDFFMCYAQSDPHKRAKNEPIAF